VLADRKMQVEDQSTRIHTLSGKQGHLEHFHFKRSNLCV
jgi:hypothetical protein